MFALVISAGAMEMRNTFIGQIPESRRVTGVGLTMGLSVGLFAYGGLVQVISVEVFEGVTTSKE
mgnify:CR=1 FL=1